MAFKSKDGKQFTNADSMRSHNRMSSAAAPPMEGEEEPEVIAAAHGPAHHIEIHHDHEMGVHEVHSDHPSGHHHMSQHGSHEEAHDHAKRLATPHEGAKESPEEDEEMAEHEGGY